MFRLKPGIKSDPVKRWNLSERVFFACGACHILAYAFLEAYPKYGFHAVWIRPAQGFTGNHVFVTDGKTAFDFHGYRCEEALIAHHWAKGRLWWPGWNGTLVPLPQDVLISEAKSKVYDGLWLREPGQFLHDAMPRAQAFLARFGPPPSGDGQAGGALLDETGLRRQIGSWAVADA
ncbi:hypothetical protein LJR090_004952 [Bosea sp. LjRoot90]|uniref:hypothetical protein n=1 Tax=Bosea sp. LjRoot90 TaxID=3342342 RepID=UPI003ED12F89